MNRECALQIGPPPKPSRRQLEQLAKQAAEAKAAEERLKELTGGAGAASSSSDPALPPPPDTPEALDENDAEVAEEEDAEEELLEEEGEFIKASDVPLEAKTIRGWRCAWRGQRPESPHGSRKTVFSRLRRKHEVMQPVAKELPQPSRHSQKKKELTDGNKRKLQRERAKSAQWEGSRGYHKRSQACRKYVL